ncbi:MAG: LamG domain-containing protein, partial [Bacteroidota bacterium]|nr:LamG domain-containing protein [Bacteroidota bacterium]
MGTTFTVAQNGDQILDGIGETGLIARYTFKDDVKDWSRNNLHGSIQGTDFRFVKDELFGSVLSLGGNSDTFISLPAESVTGEETISVTGWIYMHSAKSGQLFFDFGKDNKSHFFAAPVGFHDKEEFQAQIMTKSNSYISNSQAVAVDKWIHLAVVVNVPFKTLSTYVNGALVNETKNVDVVLSQLFKSNSGETNKLYIGKSLDSDNTGLNAKLHDFRIYRIALNDKQIARIHRNALNEGESVVRTNEESKGELQQFPATTPQLYNAYLKSVSDI